MFFFFCFGVLVPPHSEFVAPRLITPQFITSPPPYFIVPHAGDVAFEVGRSPCGHEVHDAGGQLVVQGQKRHGQIRQGDEAQGLHRKNPRGLHEEAQQRRQAHQAGLFLGGSASLLRRASYRFALPCHAIPRGERSVLVSEGFFFFLFSCIFALRARTAVVGLLCLRCFGLAAQRVWAQCGLCRAGL